MNAWEKFKKTVKNNNFVKNGDKILIAVSGGPDSVSLLHLFWRLKKNLNIELFAANMDHGLRKQSKKDSETVRLLCEKFQIPVFIKKIPVEQYADLHKMSIETAGRELRYQTLNDFAKELKCNKISTGHTANDNAETIMMWLLRGTGTEGLSGIPAFRKELNNKKIIRPILNITRSEIIDYIKSQGLAYCIDKSNFSMDYTRNRIRHKIIPLLESCNPRFIDHIFNLSQILSKENDYLNELTARALKRSVKRFSQDKISLDLKRFFRYNGVIQARILKEILPEKRSLLHIERLLEWILSKSSREISFSHLWNVEKIENKLFLIKRHNDK